MSRTQIRPREGRGTAKRCRGNGIVISSQNSTETLPLHHPADGPPPRAGEDLRKRAFAFLAATAVLAIPLPAMAQDVEQRDAPTAPAGQSYANSTAILVAEIAFARLAADQGQWTAFRDTAAPDALMMVPQPVLAQGWLKGRADPPTAMKWQVQRLFMACDGRTGGSTGSSQWPDGTVGYYTSIWQNLEKPRAKKPKWKWVLDHRAPLAAARGGDDMISSRTAACTGNPKALLGDIPLGRLPKDAPLVEPAASGARASADGTMVWRWETRADGSRTVQIELWNGSGFDTVVRDDVPAGAG